MTETREVKGIDVSSFQGKIDWDAVKSSGQVDFAWIRATYISYTGGKTTLKVDAEFVRNWAGAKRVGIPCGAYHFYNVFLDPIEQAEFLFKAVGPLEPGDLPPMVDMEVSRGGQTGAYFSKRLRSHVERLEKLFKRRVIIYTGKDVFNTNTDRADEADLTFFADHDLWLAAYVNNPELFVPSGWSKKGKTWLVWQRSGDVSAGGKPGVRVPGIVTVVDIDVTRHKNVDEFKAWIASTIVVEYVPAPVSPEPQQLPQPQPVLPPTGPQEPTGAAPIIQAPVTTGGFFAVLSAIVRFILAFFIAKR